MYNRKDIFTNNATTEWLGYVRMKGDSKIWCVTVEETVRTYIESCKTETGLSIDTSGIRFCGNMRFIRKLYGLRAITVILTYKHQLLLCVLYTTVYNYIHIQLQSIQYSSLFFMLINYKNK